MRMLVVPITDENIKAFRAFLPGDTQEPSGERTYFGLIGDEDTPVGAAIIDDAGEEIELESLFIDPGQRRKGYGSRFIYGLIEERKRIGGLFLSAEFPYNNEASRAFFLSCGFLLTNAGEIYHFWQKKVIQNKKARKMLSRDIKGDCRSVQLITREEKNLLRKFIRGMGHEDTCLDTESFSPALSSCVFDDKGHIQAFMLCSEDEHDIIVTLIGGKGECNTAILLTFKYLLDALVRRDANGRVPEDGRVVFQAQQPKIVGMAERLFNGEIECDDFIVMAVREL